MSSLVSAPRSATVSAPTNIAVIKYWGKASLSLNTPINSSVSLTLSQDTLRSVTTAMLLPQESGTNKLWLNGAEEDITANKRFQACIEGIRALSTLTDPALKNASVHISSMNTFPTAAGLASSAAGYAALVHALVQVFEAKEQYPNQFSTIARQGSGSASRSLYGGLVKWNMGGEKPDASDSLAHQCFDENYWPGLKALICVVSDAKKETSSTSGMVTSVNTSELLNFRASSGLVERRCDEIIAAFEKKDFETFGALTMKDSNQFHAVCQDTYPPIYYMNDTSRAIVQLIHRYNSVKGSIKAAYTFDAGPNAVIYCQSDDLDEITALILRYYDSPITDDGDFCSDRALNLALDHEITSACDVGREDRVVERVVSSPKPRVMSPEGKTRLKRFNTVDSSCLEAEIDQEVKEIKMIYSTSVGGGPKVLGESEALLNRFGMNIYCLPSATGSFDDDI